MSMTLGDVITAARDRHPAFHRSRVPNAVIARFLTGFQRRLISKVAEVNAELVAQQASILFDLSPTNAPGVVGAGLAGGLPAQLAAGAPVEVEETAGAALELDFENAQVLVAQAVCTAVTATSITKAVAGWVVDQWAGKHVWITDGPGLDGRRAIISNTADTLVISTGADNQQWSTLPVAGQSLFEIVNVSPSISSEMGVATAVPALAQRIGYLVRLNAQGVPYMDLAKPLLARFDVGCELPPHELLLGGKVRDAAGLELGDLDIRGYAQRRALGVNPYSGTVMNGKLLLNGNEQTWRGVASIDLRYIPIAPAFTALTDLFLLPDTAYDVIVARSALLMAARINALPDQPKVDTRDIKDEATEAEGAFMAAAGRQKRRVPQYVREVW